MPSGVFIKENIASSIFKRVTSCTQDQMLAFHSFSSSEMHLDDDCGHNEKGYQILTLEFTVSFAPLRPAGFVNFCGAGRGKACFLRGGAGRGSLFFRGAGRGWRPACLVTIIMSEMMSEFALARLRIS